MAILGLPTQSISFPNIRTIFMFAVVYFVTMGATSSPPTSNLHRIQSKIEDGLKNSEFAQLEKELDAIIFDSENAAKMQSLTGSQNLDNLHFHSNNCTVKTWDSKLLYDNTGKSAQTDLNGKVMLFSVIPKNLRVQTTFHIDRLANGDIVSRAMGKSNTLYKGLKCDGLAPLDFKPQIFIEWVQMFCDFSQLQITTEIVTNILWGSEVEMFVRGDFGRALGEKFERDVTTALESIISSWLKSKIENLPESTVLLSISNQTYQRLQEEGENENNEANEIVDGILAFASALIKENYNDSIKIPDIREGFEKNVLNIIRLGAQFTAKNGKAYGVSSIAREGPARFHTNGTKIFFSSTFRFNGLFLLYKNYHVEVIFWGPSGTIRTSPTTISARLRVHVDFSKGRAYLDRLRIAHLGAVKVQITGLGLILNSIVSHIVTWVVAAFKSQILDLLEKRVTTYVQEMLEKKTLDDLITGRGFGS